MKLYDKKFLIYGNCMIRSFGQHGRIAGYCASGTECSDHCLKNTTKFFQIPGVFFSAWS